MAVALFCEYIVIAVQCDSRTGEWTVGNALGTGPSKDSSEWAEGSLVDSVAMGQELLWCR